MKSRIDRDREARERCSRQPLYAGLWTPGYVPTWEELADSAERLRLEGETALSAESTLAARRRIDRKSPAKRSR